MAVPADWPGGPGPAAGPPSFTPEQDGPCRLETVAAPRPPASSYQGSLALLARAAAAGRETRSGLLLGLGEDALEVLEVFRDLRRAGCRRLWLGQYLRPTPAHHPVARYAAPAEFSRLAARARALGFDEVAAGPLVRSSCSDPDAPR